MPRAFCPECPHCRLVAERADLKLSHPFPRSIPGGVDRAFYLDYARVYDLARARSAQPVKLILEVNPTLTRARCGEYLKRSRGLGLVTSPGRGDDRPAAPRTEPAEPALPTPERAAERVAEPPGRVRLTADERPRLDDPAVREYLARARSLASGGSIG